MINELSDQMQKAKDLAEAKENELHNFKIETNFEISNYKQEVNFQKMIKFK